MAEVMVQFLAAVPGNALDAVRLAAWHSAGWTTMQ